MNEFDQAQIRKIDGGLLLVFRELVARRQASAVARHLGLSASAISHAIARLRELFGDPLFVRRPHGLEPTQRALELAPRIDDLVASLAKTLGGAPAFDPSTSRRRFRIICSDAIESLIGPALVNAFRTEAPLATFTARWAVLERALRAVRRGEVDVALGVFHEVPEGFTATPLYEDEYCVIARQGHPMVVGGRIDRATYATAGHVFVGNPDGALADEPAMDRRAVDEAYGKLPGPDVIRTHAYVSLWETAMLIVAETDAMADCPRRLATRHAARLGLHVLDSPTRPFAMTIQALRREDVADSGLDWLMAKISAATSA